MPALDSVHIRAATRGSALALWQTDHVSELLTRAASSAGITLTFERIVVETVADARLDIPIWEMGGKGVFVKEIQAAVLDGRADIAVHSGKDLPARTPDELVLAAVPERADPRDILIGSTLAGLRHGATVASGSVRRRAQLAALRPDLVFEGLRGNIAKRLEKSVDFDAIVMAVAAIDRLGLDLSNRVVEILEPEVMLPQVAQGALAIECSVSDDAIRTLLAMIEHAPSRLAVDAERAFLDELGGDCNLPAGAFATIDADTIIVEGLLASFDGQTVIRDRRVVDIADGATTGRSIARHLLDDLGGSALLDR